MRMLIFIVDLKFGLDVILLSIINLNLNTATLFNIFLSKNIDVYLFMHVCL